MWRIGIVFWLCAPQCFCNSDSVADAGKWQAAWGGQCPPTHGENKGPRVWLFKLVWRKKSKQRETPKSTCFTEGKRPKTQASILPMILSDSQTLRIMVREESDSQERKWSHWGSSRAQSQGGLSCLGGNPALCLQLETAVIILPGAWTCREDCMRCCRC